MWNLPYETHRYFKEPLGDSMQGKLCISDTLISFNQYKNQIDLDQNIYWNALKMILGLLQEKISEKF